LSQRQQIDRFGYEIESAFFHRGDRGVHIAVGGDHCDRERGLGILDHFDQFEAVAVG
jgi:hypothetical protein